MCAISTIVRIQHKQKGEEKRKKRGQIYFLEKGGQLPIFLSEKNRELSPLFFLFFLKSRITATAVMPAKAGIQEYQWVTKH